MAYSLFPTPLIIVAGPTASGKSGVAIELARRLNGEIVSADSLQIYRYFNIGTGKVTPEEQQQASHHLLDILDPTEDYNAGKFQKDADRVVQEIASRNKTVIVAGGTGLYIRAFLQGLFESPSDANIRQQLQEESEHIGLHAMHARLQSIDPDAAAKISHNDPIRILRALEVFHVSGRRFSELAASHRHQEKRYPVAWLGLRPPRPQLYERINQRVQAMFREGWTTEVHQLRDMGYDATLKPMQCIGYREINQMLDQKLAPEDVIPRVQKQTRAYAKRQLNWLRKDPVVWYESPQKLLDDAALELRLRTFLQEPTSWNPPLSIAETTQPTPSS